MAEKLRVGVIGCGSMARNHMYGYLRSGRYDVVALSDLSAEAMDDFDKRFSEFEDYKPNHYTNFREMLDVAPLDVVSVAVWHRGHAPLTIAAAARRPKAILCEKPMAEDLGHAQEMQVACQRNGVRLVIGHQRRFLPAYTLARELIADGEIGKVELITSLGGAGLPNYSSHQTDMYRYILGDDDCEWIMGQVERQTDQYERTTRIEDRAMAAFQFKGGARAVLLSDLVPNYFQGAQVYGTDGMIRFTTTDLDVLSARSGGWKQHRPDGQFHKYGETGFEWKEAGTGQAVELADWIEGKAESHRGEGTHGYKALEMVHGVYESARLHERVLTPVNTHVNPLDVMVEDGHLPVRYPGSYDIRAKLLRGENMSADTENH